MGQRITLVRLCLLNLALALALPGYAQNNNLSDLPELTKISREIAQGIDIFCLSALGRGTPLHASLCNTGPRGAATVGTLSQEGARPMLERIGYERTAAHGTNAVETSNAQFANISARLAALRSGAAGVGWRRFGARQDDTRPPGTLVASLAPFAPLNTTLPANPPDLSSRLGAFASGNFTVGSQDNTGGGEPGLDFHTLGPTVGVDYRFTNNLIAGAAFGYTAIDVSFDANSGDLQAHGYSLSAYGTYYTASQFYIDSLLSFGWYDYPSRRNIVDDFVDRNGMPRFVNQGARGETDGSSFTFTLGGGDNFQHGSLTYGPVGRPHYTLADIDGYRERLTFNPGNTAILAGQRLGRAVAARVTYAAAATLVEQEAQYAPLRYAGHEAGDFLFVCLRLPDQGARVESASHLEMSVNTIQT